MKAAIVLALIGSVLAAPPLRQMQRPDHDQYAHIFAEVRPAGQKPQNVELQFQPQHHAVEVELTQHLQVEEHHQHHQSSAQGEVIDVQLRPVEQNPQHVEVEIKQQHPKPSPNHLVALEVKPVEQKPQHVIELEIKPVEQKPQHVVEVEIKQQRPNSFPNHLVDPVEHRPQHVEFEIKQQQKPKPHHQNSAQGHLVSLSAQPVEQKPQHLEFDMAVGQQVELEVVQDNRPQIQYLNL